MMKMGKKLTKGTHYHCAMRARKHAHTWNRTKDLSLTHTAKGANSATIHPPSTHHQPTIHPPTTQSCPRTPRTATATSEATSETASKTTTPPTGLDRVDPVEPVDATVDATARCIADSWNLR